jgi:hypothetical protein
VAEDDCVGFYPRAFDPEAIGNSFVSAFPIGRSDRVPVGSSHRLRFIVIPDREIDPITSALHFSP